MTIRRSAWQTNCGVGSTWGLGVRLRLLLKFGLYGGPILSFAVRRSKVKTLNVIFYALLSGIVMLQEAKAMGEVPSPADLLKISSPVLSNDGSVVVFSYQYENKYPRLGIYQVASDKLAFLDLPGDLMWISPTVSPDGRYIAAVTDCYRDCPPGGESRQIALLDLSKPDVNYTFLTKGEKYRDVPMFTPDSAHVVFVTGETYILPGETKRRVRDHGYSMASILGGDEVELAPTEKGKNRFYVLGRPYFVGKERIIFSTILLDAKEPLGLEAAAFGKGAGDGIGITLDFGAQSQGYALMPENKNHVIANLTVSADGDIVFIDLNEDEPLNRNYQYELYMLRKGTVTPLTNIKSFLHTPYISGDGSRVVFLEDKNWGEDWEVMLLDMASGKITNTGIREKIIEQLRLEQLKSE